MVRESSGGKNRDLGLMGLSNPIIWLKLNMLIPF